VKRKNEFGGKRGPCQKGFHKTTIAKIGRWHSVREITTKQQQGGKIRGADDEPPKTGKKVGPQRKKKKEKDLTKKTLGGVGRRGGGKIE